MPNGVVCLRLCVLGVLYIMCKPPILPSSKEFKRLPRKVVTFGGRDYTVTTTKSGKWFYFEGDWRTAPEFAKILADKVYKVDTVSTNKFVSGQKTDLNVTSRCRHGGSGYDFDYDKKVWG